MAINLNHSRKDWNSEQGWRIEFWLLSVSTSQQPRQSQTTFFGTLKHNGLKSSSRTFSILLWRRIEQIKIRKILKFMLKQSRQSGKKKLYFYQLVTPPIPSLAGRLTEIHLLKQLTNTESNPLLV